MTAGTSIQLGVNVDHVATLRQARGTYYPDPVAAARIAEDAGADSITVHLREDRRHIQDHDIITLNQSLQTRMNLEMAVSAEMIEIATRVCPSDCCLVPENRAELTTEGGLDVAGQPGRVREACIELAAKRIRVSLFIDPERDQLEASVEAGAPVVELHTGRFADAGSEALRAEELARLVRAAQLGAELGLTVHAGHGLHYENVQAIAAIPAIRELNIGHAIIARALFDGLAKAVTDMKQLMTVARLA